MKMSKTKSWIFLIIAVIAEVIATTSLKISLGEISGYFIMGLFITVSYYFMGLCIRIIPVGVAYSIWEALGLCLIAIIGIFVFKEKLNLYQTIGIFLAIIGIILINIGQKE
ncbi:QacE family quaternary ammonium compound efflux SMR transporter [Helicobacter sp. 13S00482-2]|uniref:DMT family transporter n=1 Tax=Helicobacter sp. 13S00482-2 TaxID=1476200 RepID=UPI000BD58C30|nr:SMR family transporter [Helicobacter sp. 13S00482-2]PAF54159.1 QacE family quaternary ammonium compound efflux SMR transporter [Helicobacter sp. 13S00482-2]